MKKIGMILIIISTNLLFSCSPRGQSGINDETQDTDEWIMGLDNDSLIYPEEVHFRHLQQLTWGGDNAEAYWSFDDAQLIFQVSNQEWNTQCDQIFIYDLRKTADTLYVPTMVSTGLGRTTCSYFMPGDDKILYASTHHKNTDCPPVPERREDGLYVWPIYADYDIFIADSQGKNLKQITDHPSYDAEATVSPSGDKIVFTSMRSGDLELYTMDIDGSNIHQITDELGYDGGAFFSPDGSHLVFRASRPKTEKEISTYKSLLAEGLVQPTNLEIFICKVDGSEMKQITHLGGANWAPFFHPSGDKIIFCSNHMSERGFPFNLFLVNVDGTGIEQITFDKTFDSFPMFSNNGKYLAFSSNRNNGGTRATNLFIAEWKD